MMQQELMMAYVGCCGQVQFPVQTLSAAAHRYASCSLRHLFSQPDRNLAIQQIHAHAHYELSLLPQPGAQEYVFLAGFFSCALPLRNVVEDLASALKEGRYVDLPQGEYCGCFLSPHAVWLFKTRASNSAMFYTRHQALVRWSTDPSALGAVENEALAHCCAGRDVFVFSGIEAVPAGTVVRLDEQSTRSTIFERIAPVDFLPIPMTIPDLAAATRGALSEATRLLATSRRKVGVLLSGGIDSACVAAALAEQGADIVAYHFAFPNSAADESPYAQAVCQALAIPFVPICVSNGEADYLSERWRFPHPYGHAGLRWFEEVAEQAERDGVTIMTTGRGGDPSFGPLHSYGLHDVLRAPISSKEKLAMALGALSTDWLLPDMMKSVRRTHSLISGGSLSPTANGKRSRKDAPFLCMRPPLPLLDYWDVTRLSPQDLTVEATVFLAHGIRAVHPFHHPAVQRLAVGLPAAYRLIPYRGVKVVKPVLRRAYADALPPLVVRQRRGSWLDAPGQAYCIRYAPYLRQLLASPTSRVVERGLVSPAQVDQVLSNHQFIREHCTALLATAMTELFLRQWEAETSER